MPPEGPAARWPQRLAELWFDATNLFLRKAFHRGKASFLRAEISSTKNMPARGRLYAHYALKTGALHSGAAGWSEFREHVSRKPVTMLTAEIRCGYCGHRYVVALPKAADPLGLPAAKGSPAGYPGSFSADWFRFWHPLVQGDNALDCPRCEQQGEPKVWLF